MNFLTLENVSKSYGEKVLFSNIELYINQGQKIALIARNGTGKSTLLRIISGEEGAEGVHSKLEFHPDIRIGYLKQEPQFANNATIWEAICESDNPAVNAWNDYQSLLLINPTDDEMQKAIMRMDQTKAWNVESKMEEILEKLFLNQKDKKVTALSGGQKKRLALAQILISDPDFLILDEPTNHLDLSMIEWLEEYLMNPNITLLLITHDRYFLDRVCDTIVELDGGGLQKYAGNYSTYLEKKAIMEQVQNVTQNKNLKLLQKERDWVNRMPKARTTKNKARVEQFNELKKSVYAYTPEDELTIELKPQRLGSKIIEARYITKSFDDKLLIDKFHYKFKKNDKVGVIGPNGAGKSTLINMLTGILKPDSGSVVLGETVKFGYYHQDGIAIDEDITVFDAVTEIAEFIPLEKGRKLTAKQLLETFLFDSDKQRVLVRKLSGGEKRRLYLLTILIRNPNVLILDEPTNDIDIMTLNVLEQYLIDFPGVVIVISHDRFFMDKIVDHLFVLEGGGYIRDFPGNYSQYREKYGSFTVEESVGKITPTEEEKQSDVPDTQDKKLSYEDRKYLSRIENKIKKLETQKKEIETMFINSHSYSVEELHELHKKNEAIKNEIETLEMEWIDLVT